MGAKQGEKLNYRRITAYHCCCRCPFEGGGELACASDDTARLPAPHTNACRASSKLARSLLPLSLSRSRSFSSSVSVSPPSLSFLPGLPFAGKRERRARSYKKSVLAARPVSLSSRGRRPVRLSVRSRARPPVRPSSAPACETGSICWDLLGEAQRERHERRGERGGSRADRSLISTLARSIDCVLTARGAFCSASGFALCSRLAGRARDLVVGG